MPLNIGFSYFEPLDLDLGLWRTDASGLVKVRWGDGDVGTISGAYTTVRHQYALEGAYTIKATEIATGVSETLQAYFNALTTVDVVRRGKDVDDIMGTGSGDDVLDGRGGDDRLVAAEGNDSLTGGDGTDTLGGGAGADTLDGGEDTDYLLGGDGDDVLIGGGGTDSFQGTFGRDTMKTSADGATDRFVYFYGDANEGGDKIIGFVPGEDLIQIFFISTADNPQFASGATPTVADGGVWLLYDTDNGRLSVDLDGTGAGAAVELATLKGVPSLSLSDFEFPL